MLTNQWQLSGNISHLQKRYVDDNLAKHYDGHANSIAALALYQPQVKWLVFAGLDYMQDHLKDLAESSNRQGVRGGSVYVGEQIGMRGTVRYAARDFSANNFWYDKKRQDNEFQFSAALWHKRLSWHGFRPKLNYSYQKIDSNLPLYDRNNSTWFVTVDKTF